MRYTSYFASADQTIGHLATLVGALDPLLQMQYSGFAAISAVTVYELAIKEIFLEFASKKSRVFGHFVDQHFKRINGRIGVSDLRNQHLPRFGEKYIKNFDKLMKKAEDEFLLLHGQSIKGSYGNLITWRHEFAHEGRVPTNATFNEVQLSYDRGKKVIEVLATALVR